MPEITPLTKDQLFEKKIAENTGSNYNVGDISDVVPVTKDQSLLKEIALNSAGQSEDITELEDKVAANAEAMGAMVNVTGACNILPCEAISSTTDAVVFTVNSDGSVTAVGTPSGSYPMIRYTTNYLLKAGTYVVDSGVGSLSPLYVNVTDNANTYTIADTYNANGKTEFTLNSDTAIKVEIVGHASEALNITVYPMLYDARLNPTGYVPYAMTNRELTERVEKSPEYVADLNNLLKPGFYMTGTGVTNTPNDNDNHFINNGLFVSGNGVNYCAQMIIDTRNQLFSRICNNGTWSSWEGYTKA